MIDDYYVGTGGLKDVLVKRAAGIVQGVRGIYCVTLNAAWGNIAVFVDIEGASGGGTTSECEWPLPLRDIQGSCKWEVGSLSL